MNKRNSNLCPKCGCTYIRKHKYNSNYTIYIHKQQEGSKGLLGIIKSCIAAVDHHYQWPETHALAKKLNPNYRTSLPSEQQ